MAADKPGCERGIVFSRCRKDNGNSGEPERPDLTEAAQEENGRAAWLEFPKINLDGIDHAVILWSKQKFFDEP